MTDIRGTACVTPQSKVRALGLPLTKGPMGALGSDPDLGLRPKPVARGSFQNVVWLGHSWAPFSQGVKTRDLGKERGRPGPGLPHAIGTGRTSCGGNG